MTGATGAGPAGLPAGGPVGVRVTAPATSANLGPGFDAAGLCLSLHDEVVVRVAPGGLRVDVSGEGAATLPRDERHLVVRAVRAAFEVLGGQPTGLAVACRNRIPQARGLGSSSAAIVAGVLTARALVPGGDRLLDEEGVLALAAGLEGHPDNVAACLLGGFTLAWTEPGRVRAVRRDVHPELLPVLFVPRTQASTVHVRGLLPTRVPHADAACAVGRAALLPLALTSDLALLLAATHDTLHQQYRAAAMPATADLVGSLRRSGIAAVVSGAGPAVLALTSGDRAATVQAFAPPGWEVCPLPVDTQGARVQPFG